MDPILPNTLVYQPIEPVVIPTVGTATQLYVQADTFSASATNCSLTYYLQDEIGLILLQGTVVMTDEQFASWGTDNSVLYQIVADEKGLILI
jgi:hypothetical protein